MIYLRVANNSQVILQTGAKGPVQGIHLTVSFYALSAELSHEFVTSFSFLLGRVSFTRLAKCLTGQ